jgi:hypothetical protein
MGSIGLGLWKTNTYGIEPPLVTAREQTHFKYFNLKALDHLYYP